MPSGWPPSSVFGHTLGSCLWSSLMDGFSYLDTDEACSFFLRDVTYFLTSPVSKVRKLSALA